MELIEFHIGCAAACAPGHSDAVATGSVRIGGVEVRLAGSTGCQSDKLAFNEVYAARFEV